MTIGIEAINRKVGDVLKGRTAAEVRSRTRRLREAKMLPQSMGRATAPLDVDDLITIFVGLAASEGPKDVAEKTAAALELTSEEFDYDIGGAAIAKEFGDHPIIEGMTVRDLLRVVASGIPHPNDEILTRMRFDSLGIAQSVNGINAVASFRAAPMVEGAGYAGVQIQFSQAGYWERFKRNGFVLTEIKQIPGGLFQELIEMLPGRKLAMHGSTIADSGGAE